MGDGEASHAADAARAYYNSADVEGFYTSVWGGEDVHTGIHEHLDEPVARATRRTEAGPAGPARYGTGQTLTLVVRMVMSVGRSRSAVPERSRLASSSVSWAVCASTP
ncbi:hypothetical protein LKL35_10245 [Streptomyces sp. ET3-23]|uniref:hypothetical protein n=1 Tax=Streptomyces sp. ET3-23 TaxID=2885643 RepID=UPI001D10CB10|nr:hypothetical protein [Streptomyces sp. ET3-23]MCC2275796.1 hypothetical protein [Streptomyces sp. ET3-23]